MKKVFAILFVAGMATFAACTSAETTEATESADTLAAAPEVDTTVAPVDTTAAADTTKK
ncbi:hypothetical protein [Emticicia sp. CRIBPO]|jgi:hypothetical protein|uniref:hypothetical protein n=1 Tax=Emticicia sp. CRIBPO TaxID=2683258 RepID=UPI001412FD89|nr:hypothetical protein [Emticicia sp. CRIBPO]